jgi:hypothetical protein
VIDAGVSHLSKEKKRKEIATSSPFTVSSSICRLLALAVLREMMGGDPLRRLVG